MEKDAYTPRVELKKAIYFTKKREKKISLTYLSISHSNITCRKSKIKKSKTRNDEMQQKPVE